MGARVRGSPPLGAVSFAHHVGPASRLDDTGGLYRRRCRDKDERSVEPHRIHDVGGVCDPDDGTEL